jgi:hypothetical protein
MVELRLLQVIQSLESDQRASGSMADNYEGFIEDVNEECGQAIMGIVQRYRLMEQDIGKCLSILRAEQIKEG